MSFMDMPHIALESPDRADVIALIDQLDAYQTALYPAESNHLVDIAALRAPHVRFAVARSGDGVALACGAAVMASDFAELKRMFVLPAARGRGIAKAVLAFLEQQAAAAGAPVVRLETGIHQPEALGLYESAGYRRCGPYAGYAEDPLSVFMQKELRARVQPHDAHR